MLALKMNELHFVFAVCRGHCCSLHRTSVCVPLVDGRRVFVGFVSVSCFLARRLLVVVEVDWGVRLIVVSVGGGGGWCFSCFCELLSFSLERCDADEVFYFSVLELVDFLLKLFDFVTLLRFYYWHVSFQCFHVRTATVILAVKQLAGRVRPA